MRNELDRRKSVVVQHMNIALDGKIISVIKSGDWFNWRKFRKEPTKITIFTENGVYEYEE